MRGIRFWLLGIVSFIITTVATVFVSGSFLNRLFLAASCTIFSLNSTLCTSNLGIESESAIATSTSNLGETRDVYRNLLQQESVNIRKQTNYFVAFDSVGKEGHGQITEDALIKEFWSPTNNLKDALKDKDGNLLKFQSEATKEISLANRGVDIKPDYLDSSIFQTNTIFDFLDKDAHVYFSDTFYEPGFHFDRETFEEGSRWLKLRKADIVKELNPIRDTNSEDAKIRSKRARKYLGEALHTLQDFYAHTNWVELGFYHEIDKRLGREIIADPPGRISIDWKTGKEVINLLRRDTSEPVKQEEVGEAITFIKAVKNIAHTDKELFDLASLIPYGGTFVNFVGKTAKIADKVLSLHLSEGFKEKRFKKKQLEELELESDDLKLLAEDLATAISMKPGILSPKFRDSRDKRLLTSGYFMGIDPIGLCSVPNGKTRHGGPSFLSMGIGNDRYGVCPNGLNKDDSSVNRNGYQEAFFRATEATEDYVKQIIFDEPNISGNIPAIKALMGMKDPPKDPSKENPCKSKENQKREECQLKPGRSHNDPHLATFDGFRYDLQTLGEFILTKSNDGTFEVQTRQAPYASSLSINSAIAMKVGSDRVALYTREFPDADTSTPLRVNGKPTTIQGDKLALTGGGEILKQGSTYVISSPRGEKVLVSPSGAGNKTFFNISPFVYNRSGTYSGLLGNVNGNPNDDLQTRGGSNVLAARSTYGDVNKVLNLVGLRAPGALDRAEQAYFDQLYKQFANSWRVKQEESLFDYPAGKTTESYVNPGFPSKYLTLNMLSADQIQKARTACTEAKVTQDLMEGCIFDVGFSGFSEFARTAAEITSYVKTVNQLFPGSNIPTPEQTVNRVIPQLKKPRCLPFIGCH